MVKFNSDRLDQVFYALSDRTRRNIIERLSKGPSNASALASSYKMSFPAVSKHLRILEQSRLVQVRKLGRQRVFFIEAGELAAARTWMDYWAKFWNSSLDSLENFLSKNN